MDVLSWQFGADLDDESGRGSMLFFTPLDIDRNAFRRHRGASNRRSTTLFSNGTPIGIYQAGAWEKKHDSYIALGSNDGPTNATQAGAIIAILHRRKQPPFVFDEYSRSLAHHGLYASHGSASQHLVVIANVPSTVYASSQRLSAFKLLVVPITSRMVVDIQQPRFIKLSDPFLRGRARIRPY